MVTTQPGSKSQQNVQRQGFELVYARAVLVRERLTRSRRAESAAVWPDFPPVDASQVGALR